MLIDWFTVGAQIVNFLILLVLLKIFLYDRIIAAMDRRRQRIDDRMAAAEEKRRQADEEAESLREQRRQIEEQRDRMLAEAEDAAAEKRRKMEEKARREVAGKRKTWEKQLKEEHRDLVRELRRSVAVQVFAITRSLLADLADQPLGEKITQVFCRRLRGLDENRREELRQAVSGENAPVVVRSAFAISEDGRGQIAAALEEVVGEAVKIRYETDAEPIAGIELKAAGKKVTWHARGYLDRLEKQVLSTVESHTEENSPDELEESETAESDAAH